MRTRKTWREKLEKQQPPKVVAIPPKMRKRLGTGTLLIPTPLEVDALIRTVKRGQLTTYSRIREFLAAMHCADTTCPMVTGIFVWISANAAEEDALLRKPHITPYWRVLKDNGALNPRFPGGVKAQAQKLRAEGHVIDSSRKIPRVVAFEQRLAVLGAAAARA
jgi:alkylated DNA nucleotide flippase Atl1